MNLLQHIQYYQFSCVFGSAQQHQFLFYNTGTIGVTIATGLAFSTHLYDGPAFSSPAFSARVNRSRVFQSRVFYPLCKMVSRFQSPPPPRTASLVDVGLAVFYILTQRLCRLLADATSASDSPTRPPASGVVATKMRFGSRTRFRHATVSSGVSAPML